MTNIRVGVYWTLKEWYWNHWVMKRARGDYIKKDFIQVDSLDDVWFPRIKVSNDSNKWLSVEIYDVDKDWLQQLDWLEWYTESATDNHYNRIKVKTKLGEEISVYEIVDDIYDILDDFKLSENWDEKFYNWTDKDDMY